MARELLIYCDESTARGAFFSNFYGGALVESSDLEMVNARLSALKVAQGFGGEVKWAKISEAYEERYAAFIDEVFDLVEEGKIKLRIMFSQNANVPPRLTPDQLEHGYFLLYYQFIKHAFGLQHANPDGEPLRVRVYLDQIPDTREKADAFRGFVSSLSRSPPFRKARVSIAHEDVADVSSHDHVILQAVDVVLGAMQFRLNNLHKAIPPGHRRRGKRTRAKERLFKQIQARIFRGYPRFNIGVSTGTQDGPEVHWSHPYRHWLFVPNGARFDPDKAKR